MTNKNTNKKVNVKSIWQSLIIKPLKKLNTSDKIAALALLITIFSIYFTIFQFRESQKQFVLQRHDDKENDSINQINLQNQFSEIRRKNDADIEYYKQQLFYARHKDSIDNSNYFHQRQHDSIQDNYTIKHQRLSVKPYLTIEAVDDQVSQTVGIFVTNVGLGPGIFTKFDFYYKGQKLKNLKELSDLLVGTEDEFFLTRMPQYREFYDTGFTIYPNKTLEIYWTQKDNVKSYYALTNVLFKYLCVDYEVKSFYGDIMKYTWNKRAKNKRNF